MWVGVSLGVMVLWVSNSQGIVVHIVILRTCLLYMHEFTEFGFTIYTGSVWYDTIQFGMVLYGMVWNGMVRYGLERYGAVLQM